MEVASLTRNQHGSVGGFGGEAGGKEQKFVYWRGLSEKGNIEDFIVWASKTFSGTERNSHKGMYGFSIVTIKRAQSTLVKNVCRGFMVIHVLNRSHFQWPSTLFNHTPKEL